MLGHHRIEGSHSHTANKSPHRPTPGWNTPLGVPCRTCSAEESGVHGHLAGRLALDASTLRSLEAEPAKATRNATKRHYRPRCLDPTLLPNFDRSDYAKQFERLSGRPGLPGSGCRLQVASCGSPCQGLSASDPGAEDQGLPNVRAKDDPGTEIWVVVKIIVRFWVP